MPQFVGGYVLQLLDGARGRVVIVLPIRVIARAGDYRVEHDGDIDAVLSIGQDVAFPVGAFHDAIGHVVGGFIVVSPGPFGHAVDVYLDLNGYPVMFTDTAGLREVEDAIEKKGIEIAYQKIQEADLVLCLFDSLTDSVQSFENIAKSFYNKISEKLMAGE